MRSYPTSLPGMEDRRKVKSAYDENYDPHWGEMPTGQRIDGQGFADLREDMNERRRQTARRMDRGC